jgi:phosphoglycerate dehydrogenase-like enzyme
VIRDGVPIHGTAIKGVEVTMQEQLSVLIHGASHVDEVPGLSKAGDIARWRFAKTLDELERELDGAQVLLGWDFRAGDLEQAWRHASELRWVHWGGAGVDALLFPALVESDVQITNARGAFDVPMAEYVLGLVIAMAKGFATTLKAQGEHRWHYRTEERIAGKRALVVGSGSIGRAIARLLAQAGLQVRGVGRTARDGDADFGHVHGIGELDALLPEADYVVLITPLTADTRGLFDTGRFACMHPGARFINVGRGALVDETALLKALNAGALAGAALDVFQEEPLPADSPLWDAPNLLVSPHMSGDTHDFKQVVAQQFLDNLKRYVAGEPLENCINKNTGFAL